MVTRVFHTRLRHFVVQAERLIDPSLATRPIAVITSPAQNGTILDLSSEALEEGLTKGMRVSLARKVSPQAILLPFNGPLYQKVQSTLLGCLNHFSPVVEPAGYGSYFLDMSGIVGLYRSYGQAGHIVAQDVARQLSLAPQVGIGRNKLVSAIATKLPPECPVREVPVGNEISFLAPLKSNLLPVAKEKTVHQALTDLNLLIVRDIQQLVVREILGQVVFGAYARRVTAQAQGIDTSVVHPPQSGNRGIVERFVLPEDTNDEGQLLGAVQLLADSVGFHLRQSRRIARRVVFMVHYTDGYEHRVTGQLLRNDALAVNSQLACLYQRANRRRERVRSITIEASRLEPFAQQMSLFDSGPAKHQRLSHQLDRIRERYGRGSVLPAITLRDEPSCSAT